MSTSNTCRKRLSTRTGRVEHMLPFRQPFNNSEIYADKRPKTDIGSTDTCKLSAMQQAQVDGFAQALAVNTTCTLNITFGT